MMDEAVAEPFFLDDPRLDHIQRRLADWLTRLTDFLDEQKAWAESEGWRESNAAPVALDDDIMQAVGVEPIDQPALRLERPEGRFTLFG